MELHSKAFTTHEQLVAYANANGIDDPANVFIVSIKTLFVLFWYE